MAALPAPFAHPVDVASLAAEVVVLGLFRVVFDVLESKALQRGIRLHLNVALYNHRGVLHVDSDLVETQSRI